MIIIDKQVEKNADLRVFAGCLFCGKNTVGTKIIANVDKRVQFGKNYLNKIVRTTFMMSKSHKQMIVYLATQRGGKYNMDIIKPHFEV